MRYTFAAGIQAFFNDDFGVRMIARWSPGLQLRRAPSSSPMTPAPLRVPMRRVGLSRGCGTALHRDLTKAPVATGPGHEPGAQPAGPANAVSAGTIQTPARPGAECVEGSSNAIEDLRAMPIRGPSGAAAAGRHR